MSQSFTEENYLKAIYHLSRQHPDGVSTNALAERMETKASSVTDMVKRLAEKNLVEYKKYQGVKLSYNGHQIAVRIIRKHRLWEVFLVEKLGFEWDEVHEIAEELEHINSDELIDRLDNFLGNPKYDPHGGAIPDSEGKFPEITRTKLSQLPVGKESKVLGLTEHSSSFMEYLNRTGISVGTEFKLKARHSFDNSVEIELDQITANLSHDVAQHIYVTNTNGTI